MYYSLYTSEKIQYKLYESGFVRVYKFKIRNYIYIYIYHMYYYKHFSKIRGTGIMNLSDK